METGNPFLPGTEFLKDGEQEELVRMPIESTTAPPLVAPVRFGRNVKIGRNVLVSPYNQP